MLRVSVCADTLVYDFVSDQYLFIRSPVLQILTDTVKDNDRRIDRVTDNRQHAGDECAEPTDQSAAIA